MFDGIRDLQQKLDGDDRSDSSESEIKEEVLQVPVFLQNGLAVFDDHSLKEDKGNAAATGIKDFTFQRRL